MNIQQYKKYSILAVLVLMFLSQGQLAFAGQGQSPSEWFNGIINRLIDMVIWPVFLGLVVIMFIWAGILYLTAQGEPSKIAQANKAVIYAVIGIIVAIFAFSAVGLIRGIIG